MATHQAAFSPEGEKIATCDFKIICIIKQTYTFTNQMSIWTLPHEFG